MTEKVDKRKISSKGNLAKAREAKLAKLKQEKETKQQQSKYEFYDESESDASSESDDEVIVVKSKNKKQPNHKKSIEKPVEAHSDIKAEISELKQLLSALTVKKKSKKKNRKPSQVVVVNPSQPPTPKPNPEIDSLKQRVLLNFN